MLLWLLIIGIKRCRIDIGKSKPKEKKDVNLRNNNVVTTDLVQMIEAGDTKSISVKKDIKYSTPLVEDLIPEDELYFNHNTHIHNQAEILITEELISR